MVRNLEVAYAKKAKKVVASVLRQECFGSSNKGFLNSFLARRPGELEARLNKTAIVEFQHLGVVM